MQQGQQSSQKPWLGNRNNKTNPLHKILTSKQQTKPLSSISRGLLSQQRVSNAAPGFHPSSHTWQQSNASVGGGGGGGGGGLDSQSPAPPYFSFSPPLSKDDIPSDTQILSQDTLHMHINNNNNPYPRPPPQQTAHRLLESMVMRGVNSLNHHQHHQQHHQPYPNNNNNNNNANQVSQPPLNFSFSPPTAPESLPPSQQQQQQQQEEYILTRVKHLEDMVTGVEDRVSQGITTLETTLLSSFQSGLEDISNKIKDQHASLLSAINNDNDNNNNKGKVVGVVYMNAEAQTDAYGPGASNGMVLAATAATLHSHHTIDQPSPSTIVASHNGTTGTGTEKKKKKEEEEEGGDGNGTGDDYGHGGRGDGGGVFGDLESLFDDEVQGGGGGGGWRGGGRKRRRDTNVVDNKKEEEDDDGDKEMQEMERRVKAKLAKHHRQLAKQQQQQSNTDAKGQKP